MAFVVGVFARSPANPLQRDDFAELAKALETGPWESLGFLREPRLQLAWRAVDGSCSAPQTGEDGSVSMLWGGLYRDGHGESANLEFLRTELQRDDGPGFATISGDFGFVYHDATHEVLHLVTDKLGVRSLYVHCGTDKVWFSNSLKVLERLPGVPKVMNLRAATEMAFFGWPIGDRTAYRDICVLRPGERLRIDPERVRSEFYWRWNTLPTWSGSREDCVAELATSFRTAIRRRRGGDRRVFSLLSGGLDSRMIATALREQGAEVYTSTFSPPGTQDQVYGEQVARALGCHHFTQPLERGRSPNLWVQLSDAWRQGLIDSPEPVDRQHWAFVGVGGSTGFGTVFWDDKLIEHFRQGRTREGIECFFSRIGWQLLDRLYRPEDVQKMRECLVEGVLEQMREFPCEDPARSFHLFIMMNDQRRHLFPYWENAATHGMQFHVPFLDSHFLERMLTFPLDWGLRHELYYQWMEAFDPAARSVPWQVYPGHKPCPVPASQELPTQWANDGKYVLKDLTQSSRLLSNILATRPFPDFLSRRYLRFVQLRLALGADYSYAVEKARIYRDVWVQSGGRHVWS